MGVSHFIGYGAARGGIELRVHDESSLLPANTREHLFGRAIAVDAGSIDLVVSVLLKDVDDFAGFFGRFDAGT